MLKQGKWVIKEDGMFYMEDYVIDGIKIVRISMQQGKPSFIKLYIGAQPRGFLVEKGGIEYLKKLAIEDLQKEVAKLLEIKSQEIKG